MLYLCKYHTVDVFVSQDWHKQAQHNHLILPPSNRKASTGGIKPSMRAKKKAPQTSSSSLLALALGSLLQPVPRAHPLGLNLFSVALVLLELPLALLKQLLVHIHEHLPHVHGQAVDRLRKHRTGKHKME